MSVSGVPESGRAATELFHTLLEHVYNPNAKYRPVPPLHQEEGDVLFTHAIPAKKEWVKQTAFIDEHQPQEKYVHRIDLCLKDSDDDLKYIKETAKWFHSTHVDLKIKFKDKVYRGSGALVGPHHILTCGDHVHEDEWADSITVYPTLNDNAPFRACKVVVVKAYTFTEWTQQKDPRYNIALLILNEAIGEFTGWNGLLCTPDSYLLNEEVNIIGYPADKRFIQMCYTKHKVRKIESEQFYYSNDTQATTNGSAICINKWNTSMIVGVQTLGRDQQQFGIRLTRQKLEVLSQTIAENFKAYPSIAFGQAEWEKYFGDVGIEPPLPPNIDEILNGPCPIWPNKKVYETHLLTLIPQTVNGKPLTLKLLGELVQKPLQGNATKYRYFNLGEYTDPPAPASHWALMSRDVIPNSRNKTFRTQKELVQNHPDYQVPNILDAAVSILMEYISTETRLYNDSPWTFTRCQEKYNKNWQLVAGGFSSDGLGVYYYDYVLEHDGVSVLRKF